MSASITVKRSELYRLVWQVPMGRLAKRYGLSDVGLAKICHKHNIPSPPRGYWAKKYHGQKPRRITLPKSESDDEIEMHDPNAVVEALPEVRAEADAKKATERKRELPITVAESLRGAHDLVSRANQELKSAKTDPHGFITCESNRVLDVHVSKQSLRRALLIMDALLKGLEQRGYATNAGPLVTILGAPLKFGISESMETVEEPREDDDDLDESYSFHFNRVNVHHRPSGRLTLSIHDGGAYWTRGCRYTWRDTDKKKLEERLNQFVAGLVEFAARWRVHAKAQEEARERMRAEAEKKEAEARELAEKRRLYLDEKARFDLLITQVENWQRSRLVRELIEVARSAHSANGPIEPGSHKDEWLKWATLQADRQDPLTASPPSILDENLGPEPEPQYRRTW
jgi:hypothetical protein